MRLKIFFFLYNIFNFYNFLCQCTECWKPTATLPHSRSFASYLEGAWKSKCKSNRVMNAQQFFLLFNDRQ